MEAFAKKEGLWIPFGDVCPRNVLKDSQGNYYVIDAEISKTY